MGYKQNQNLEGYRNNRRFFDKRNNNRSQNKSEQNTDKQNWEKEKNATKVPKDHKIKYIEETKPVSKNL